MAILRSPPLQRVRRRLNTIPEDIRESQYAKSDSHVEQEAPPKPESPPQLKLQTSGLSSISSRRHRIISPLSAGTASSCSDTEWQHQMQGLDELYDATDTESEGDECPSTTPAGMKKYLSLTIPPCSVQGPHKSSPVPPTPPPKIPVSPAALSKLARSVPAVHAPPSLDGSVTSDQVSSTSAPATPDLQSVPDNDWNTEEVRVHLDLNLEDSQNPDSANPNTSSDAQEIEIAIEDTDEDWRQFLGKFPAVPSRTAPHTSMLSLNLDAEPAREPTPDYSINLPEDALDLLRHIHLDGTPEPWSETSEAHEEMWQVDPSQDHIPKTEDATPASALSGYSFTSLSIPSPGGFFAALTPRARHTWSFPKPDNPSSAAAEDFYNLPFGRDDDGEIVEQVIEYYQRSNEGELTAVPALEGPPTAVRVPAEVTSPEDQHSPLSPTADTVDEIPRAVEFNTSGEYDEHYHEELQRKAETSRDRTSVWLTAQASYLAALSETNPVNSPVDESPAHGIDDGTTGRVSSEQSREKSARFAETLPEPTSSLPSATASKDSIYWRGFQYLRQVSNQLEAFKHRDLRFDAVQSDRLGLTKLHANRLLGNYELTRHERPAYKGPFSQAPRHSTLMSVLAEKADFSLLEKEQLVLAQIRQSLWAMDALRFLNGGNLLTSPASRRLAKAAVTKSSKNDKRCLRVLDLGGHATCEWGWYLARDNPDVSVYTVFTEQQKVNRGIKGPSNHRQVSVSHLWKLPFGDNKFDVISARSLPALLKTECPTGEDKDEYDLCLQECYRCLKPGGYLEFFTMDAELSHAAPYASATSVEFAFNLRTRGYDPNPTKNFLSRLRKTNMTGIRRAWMFLPMGVEPRKCQPPRETSGLCIEGSQLDSSDPAGSTANVASLTGLFGGWMWEQWLLKLQMEMGRDGDRLLEGAGGVFDEGRKNGAGWTCLTGWAMKPRRR
ncbi:uncharacterized protein ACHE_31373S [Aspergillus chevalieri]|uniref:Methyltransferase type 11 domain-containing protein n=1 Tax=Aspergillus chevalieri TaxID=182096 RepID=A0A7R7VML0_ASPCH|nr:uncharacterized protein ACHE_31373S [Aspergillus chevalieri]BCR87386.1 hypothetical protein ACHE_31373S [Aspergillus chevalieri]